MVVLTLAHAEMVPIKDPMVMAVMERLIVCYFTCCVWYCFGFILFSYLPLDCIQQSAVWVMVVQTLAHVKIVSIKDLLVMSVVEGLMVCYYTCCVWYYFGFILFSYVPLDCM